jgi:hypothetical protein
MNEFNMESKINGPVNEPVQESGESSDSRKKRLADLAKQAEENKKGLEKSLKRLQESLDDITLHTKYQIFDLEATRKENAYLRKLLEDEGYEF